jgi:hypothetical protein
LITQRSCLLALLLLGGCSFTLKADKKACKKNDDCGVPLECRAGLCLAKSDCSEDADCRALGSKYANTICVESTCGMPECIDPEECEGDTPSFTCLEGRCQDPVWGCIGEPDDREITTPTATFKVQVVGLISKAALPDLKIEACASVDTLCQSPLREPVITYENQIVTVTGLPQNSSIHLKFEASEHITTDFYSQRLVRNETVEEIIELVPTVLFGALGASLGVDVDIENNASINVLTVDCSEPPVPQAGIRLTLSDTLETTEIYYVTDGNLPDTKLDSTTVAGAAGAVNLQAGKQITIKALLGDRVISSFPVTPYANRMTYVNLYPRLYKP